MLRSLRSGARTALQQLPDTGLLHPDGRHPTIWRMRIRCRPRPTMQAPDFVAQSCSSPAAVSWEADTAFGTCISLDWITLPRPLPVLWPHFGPQVLTDCRNLLQWPQGLLRRVSYAGQAIACLSSQQRPKKRGIENVITCQMVSRSAEWSGNVTDVHIAFLACFHSTNEVAEAACRSVSASRLNLDFAPGSVAGKTRADDFLRASFRDIAIFPISNGVFRVAITLDTEH